MSFTDDPRESHADANAKDGLPGRGRYGCPTPGTNHSPSASGWATTESQRVEGSRVERQVSGRSFGDPPGRGVLPPRRKAFRCPPEPNRAYRSHGRNRRRGWPAPSGLSVGDFGTRLDGSNKWRAPGTRLVPGASFFFWRRVQPFSSRPRGSLSKVATNHSRYRSRPSGSLSSQASFSSSNSSP